METLYEENGILRLKRPEAQVSEKKEPVIDYYKKSNYIGPFMRAWHDPVGKAIIITVGATGVVVVTGYSLRLLAWWLVGYNEFVAAGNPPKG